MKFWNQSDQTQISNFAFFWFELENVSECLKFYLNNENIKQGGFFFNALYFLTLDGSTA